MRFWAADTEKEDGTVQGLPPIVIVGTRGPKLEPPMTIDADPAVGPGGPAPAETTVGGAKRMVRGALLFQWDTPPTEMTRERPAPSQDCKG